MRVVNTQYGWAGGALEPATDTRMRTCCTVWDRGEAYLLLFSITPPIEGNGASGGDDIYVARWSSYALLHFIAGWAGSLSSSLSLVAGIGGWKKCWNRWMEEMLPVATSQL